MQLFDVERIKWTVDDSVRRTREMQAVPAQDIKRQTDKYVGLNTVNPFKLLESVLSFQNGYELVEPNLDVLSVATSIKNRALLTDIELPTFLTVMAVSTLDQLEARDRALLTARANNELTNLGLRDELNKLETAFFEQMEPYLAVNTTTQPFPHHRWIAVRCLQAEGYSMLGKTQEALALLEREKQAEAVRQYRSNQWEQAARDSGLAWLTLTEGKIQQEVLLMHKGLTQLFHALKLFPDAAELERAVVALEDTARMTSNKADLATAEWARAEAQRFLEHRQFLLDQPRVR